jgi:hypothetical protein
MVDGGQSRPAIETAVSRQDIPPQRLPFPKQHDKHVQHDDGQEQDDENPQNRPEPLADDGSNHVRDRDRQRAVVDHVPAAAVDCRGAASQSRNIPSAGLTDRLRLSRRDRALLP